MSRFSTLRGYLRADKGVAAIEFAFIFPIMLFLYFGLLDLTGLISHNRKISSVASSVADIVSQNRAAVVKTDMNDYFKIASLVMKPHSDSRVRIRVHVYRLVSGSIQKIWTVENGKGANCASNPSTTGMAQLMANGNDLIVTQACTTFIPYTGEFLGQVILGYLEPKVEQTITMSPRASRTLNCFTTSSLTTPC